MVSRRKAFLFVILALALSLVVTCAKDPALEDQTYKKAYEVTLERLKRRRMNRGPPQVSTPPHTAPNKKSTPVTSSKNNNKNQAELPAIPDPYATWERVPEPLPPKNEKSVKLSKKKMEKPEVSKTKDYNPLSELEDGSYLLGNVDFSAPSPNAPKPTALFATPPSPHSSTILPTQYKVSASTSNSDIPSSQIDDPYRVMHHSDKANDPYISKMVSMAAVNSEVKSQSPVMRRGVLGEHLSASTTHLAKSSSKAFITVSRRGHLGDQLLPRNYATNLAQTKMKTISAAHLGSGMTGFARLSAQAVHTSTRKGDLMRLLDSPSPAAGASSFTTLAQVSSEVQHQSPVMRRGVLGENLNPKIPMLARTESATLITVSRRGHLSELAQSSSEAFHTVSKRGHLGDHLMKRDPKTGLAHTNSKAFITVSKRGHLGDQLLPRQYTALAQSKSSEPLNAKKFTSIQI